jgi:hypothetical protein
LVSLAHAARALGASDAIFGANATLEVMLYVGEGLLHDATKVLQSSVLSRFVPRVLLGCSILLRLKPSMCVGSETLKANDHELCHCTDDVTHTLLPVLPYIMPQH